MLEALADTRAVVVQGARQVGKTTLVADVTRRLDGRLVTPDDAQTRSAAIADPAEFLRQGVDGLLAIDEGSTSPDLVLALKLAVDHDPRPGRFLLTSSANPVEVADDSGQPRRARGEHRAVRLQWTRTPRSRLAVSRAGRFSVSSIGGSAVATLATSAGTWAWSVSPSSGTQMAQHTRSVPCLE